MSRFSYDKNNDQLTLISGSYKNMIAKEESSPTSKGYSVGDHFIYNGILYKVTAPIGSGVTGGAIVTSGINTNVILADTVESRIDSINEALSDEVEVRAKTGVYNLFDVLGSEKQNVSVSSAGVITNTNTDSRSMLQLRLLLYYEDGTNSAVISEDVSGTGEKSFSFTATKNVVKWYFVHNGANRNIALGVDCSVKAGDYELSFKLISNDPTTVGGLVIEKLIIKSALDAYTGYLPYAMNNRELTESKAEKSELTSISQTGSTATQAILAGTYFYLNGLLVKAKADIANGATFTLNTNYEEVTSGGLNSLAIKRLYNGASVKTIADKYVATADSELTLRKRSLVILQANVNYAWPKGIGFAQTISDDITDMALIGSLRTIDVNNSPLVTMGIFNPGTWYVALKGSATSEQGCAISILIFEL